MDESVLRLQKYRLVELNCSLAPLVLLSCVSHMCLVPQLTLHVVRQGYFRLHRVKSELETMGRDTVQLLVDSGKVAAAARQSVSKLMRSLPQESSVCLDEHDNNCVCRKTRAWHWRLRLNA